MSESGAHMLGRLTVVALGLAGLVLSPAPIITNSADYSPDEVFVIDLADPGIAYVGDSVFYPTGHVDPGTVIVIPDHYVDPSTLTGLPLEDVINLTLSGLAETQREIDRTLTRRSYGYIAPPLAWSGIYKGTVGYFGYEGANLYYWFNVTEGSNQQACAQGVGHYRGYNGSEMGVWRKWYGLGCASSNYVGGASVPWGNILAIGEFRAQSTVLHLASGHWGY
nr:hypothetical protein [Actinomycetales bacterium]